MVVKVELLETLDIVAGRVEPGFDVDPVFDVDPGFDVGLRVEQEDEDEGEEDTFTPHLP
jgi:hypothetical protein